MNVMCVKAMVAKDKGGRRVNLMLKVNYNELHTIEGNRRCTHKENLPDKT